MGITEVWFSTKIGRYLFKIFLINRCWIWYLIGWDYLSRSLMSPEHSHQ